MTGRFFLVGILLSAINHSRNDILETQRTLIIMYKSV